MNRKDLEALIGNLPTRDLILHDKHTRESAVLIPIVEKEDQLYILFEKRSKWVSQPGEICFPGGRKELKDANMEATALRETTEELGLSLEDILIIGKQGVLVSHPRFHIHSYIGYIQWQEIFHKRYNAQEVEEIILIEIEALKKAVPEIYKVRVKAFSYEVDEEGLRRELFPSRALELSDMYDEEWDMGYRSIVVYRLDSLLVWGITGQLLMHFMELLKGPQDEELK